MSENSRRFPWVKLLLVLLPLWLVGSSIGGFWLHQRNETRRTQEAEQRFARAVSETSIQDDLEKITQVIGERNTASLPAATNLSRMAAMIEGLLGPSNVGFAVTRERGPGDWPLLHVTLPGAASGPPPLWVVAAYDSAEGSPGIEENATGLASLFAVAQDLAREKPRSAIHFIFIPHFYDSSAPVDATLGTLAALIRASGPPKAVICVESTGGGGPVALHARDRDLPVLRFARDLGALDPAESEFDGLAAALADRNLPTIRIRTNPRSASAGENLPNAGAVADASGRIAEYLRRCASSPQ